MHVLQPLGLMAPPEMAMGYAPELADMKKPAQELVERIAEQLRDAGFKAETAVEVGDVRERILDSASEWRADLIVLGSHGKRGLQRFLLGSVAEFVARHAKCWSRSSAPRQGTDLRSYRLRKTPVFVFRREQGASAP